MPSPFARTTRSLAQDTAATAWWAWASAALLLAGWLGWMVAGRVTVVELSTRARLEARQAAHPVVSAAAGRVVRQALVVGEVVRAGTVLVELDTTAESGRLREAQARLQALPAQLAALQAELDAQAGAAAQEQQAALAAQQAASARVAEASAGAGFAADQERRLRDEAAAGSVPAIDALRAAAEGRRLGAQREALAADARRAGAEAAARAGRQRALAAGLARQRAALLGEQAGLQAQVARLAADIDQARIRAPIAGRVADVAPLRVGEVLAPGQRLATVLPAGDLVVVADFAPAVALGRLRPGQGALLRLEGFPWAQHGSLAARVVQVAGEVRDGLVRVELALAGPPPSGLVLQHGMPGAVEVAVEAVAPAVLVLRASGQALAAVAATAPAATAVPAR